MIPQHAEIDAALADALADIDRGTLALHLLHNTASPDEQRQRAREARDTFDAALRKLELFEGDVRDAPAWEAIRREAYHSIEVWRAKAWAGRVTAEAQLAEGGAS